MHAATAQFLAALMTAAHGTIWVLVSGWERPGRDARLRVGLQPPRLIGRGGDLAQVAPLLYPAFVAVAPGWGYDGWLNWSTRIDLLLQGIGLGLWVVGTAVLVWAARVLGRYLSVDGVTVDHELMSSGPYRYVRHPVYGSFTAIAVGLSLVFRSYLLAGVAVVWVMATVWWVAAEEALLASPEGLGDAYFSYTEGTGRFLPRLRRAQG